MRAPRSAGGHTALPPSDPAAGQPRRPGRQARVLTVYRASSASVLLAGDRPLDELVASRAPGGEADKGEAMDFTVEQFLNVFERYNEALWPLQIVAYAVGIALVVLALTRWKRASAVIFGVLAILWAGMAVGYMWLYFADINPAARLFGAIFLVQAVLLAVMAVKERGALLRRQARRAHLDRPRAHRVRHARLPAARPGARTRLSACPDVRPRALPDDDLHLRHAPAGRAAKAPPGLAASGMVRDRFLRGESGSASARTSGCCWPASSPPPSSGASSRRRTRRRRSGHHRRRPCE